MSRVKKPDCFLKPGASYCSKLLIQLSWRRLNFSLLFNAKMHMAISSSFLISFLEHRFPEKQICFNVCLQFIFYIAVSQTLIQNFFYCRSRTFMMKLDEVHSKSFYSILPTHATLEKSWVTTFSFPLKFQEFENPICLEQQPLGSLFVKLA